MAAPSASARTIRPAETPTAMKTQTIAIAMNARNPWRTPQPIEPRIHSPRNSAEPMMTMLTAAMTSAMATAPRAATWAIWPPIAVASAFASSTWAMTSR